MTPSRRLPGDPVSLGAAEAIQAANDLLATIGDEPVVAWWHVDTPTLVLGRGERRHQDPADTSVPVVRRGSGGGPVLWGPHLLAFDVIVPRSHPLHVPDITAAYEWLGEAIAEGLRDVDLPARTVPAAEAHAANQPDLAAVSCFGGLSPWEVVVDGRKIVGLSQIRRRNGLILQVGLLARPEDPPLWQVLGEDPAMGRRLADHVTSLADMGVADTDAVRAAVDRRVTEALSAA